MLMTAPWAATAADPPPSRPAKQITLQMAKTPIEAALRLIAEQGGLNVVIGPEVQGEVSVFLDQVPVKAALEAIVVHNGFTYQVADGLISVSRPIEATAERPPPMTSRVFTLRAQDAHRVKQAIEHALTRYGKMTVLDESSATIYSPTRLNTLGGDTGSFTTNLSAQTANQSAQVNRPGVPGAPGSQLGPGMISRKLIVTDIAERVEVIAGLIADLDDLPPQVLIEARIVEMTTDLQRQLGIDWNVEALGTGPILNHEWPLNNRAGFASGDQIARSPSGNPFSTAGLALGTVDFSRFTALLQARQDDNAIRLLANPRMLVFNNHSASILVGERYPILEANITDFGTLTESFDTYIPVGIQLEVTPTILPDGRISLMVHPSTSALGDDVVGTTGIRVARIQVRELDTRVVVRDGQTIVLGGLLSDRKVHAASKIPGLGDWPIFSIFFRQESPRSSRVDLMVFLTARVDGATEMSERDRQIYDTYRPHFKHIERLQDVPLHFEIPTEYEPPKPMFSDPPNVGMDDDDLEDNWAPPSPARPAGPRTPESSPDVEEMVPESGPPVRSNRRLPGPEQRRAADQPTGAGQASRTGSAPHGASVPAPLATAALPPAMAAYWETTVLSRGEEAVRTVEPAFSVPVAAAIRGPGEGRLRLKVEPGRLARAPETGPSGPARPVSEGIEKDGGARPAGLTIGSDGRIQWAEPSGPEEHRSSHESQMAWKAMDGVVVERLEAQERTVGGGDAREESSPPRVSANGPRRLLPGDARRLRGDLQAQSAQRRRARAAAGAAARADGGAASEDSP